MARKNIQETIYTHEGGKAKKIHTEFALRRSVLSCLLWENSFYEDGESIAQRIQDLVPKVSADKVAALAIEAREEMNLRHVPLWIVRSMARIDTHKHLVADTLARVIQRPDEIAEFLALYWEDGRQPLSAQVKKGIAWAFPKFNEYKLAKYDRAGKVRLRDALFLSHAKPKDEEQAAIWKRLIEGELVIPDTWEVALSAGEDKKESFERLMAEKKLGAMAFLRNLRNMQQASVPVNIIRQYISELNFGRVLPFRFIAAARYAPQLEPELEVAMLKALEGEKKILGETVLLVDVSGSMSSPIGGRSEMSRMDAAAALAVLLREVCEHVQIYTFSSNFVSVPPRRGFALRDAIFQSQRHGMTYLGGAVGKINDNIECDRLVVFTDEQSADRVPDPVAKKAYMINVASNQNGVGYGPWTHLDGFSASVIKWLREFEENEGGKK